LDLGFSKCRFSLERFNSTNTMRATRDACESSLGPLRG
jgi:hypothetical protein